MSDKPSSKFHELSNELSDFERRKLLQRLSVYNPEKEDYLTNNNKNQPEQASNIKKKEYIDKVLKSIGFLRKIILMIKSFFRGQKVENIIIEDELNRIKRELNNHYGKYFNFQEQKFTHHFIAKFMPLLVNIKFIMSDFVIFDEDKVHFYDFLAFMIEKTNNLELTNILEETLPENIENKKEFLDKNKYLIERDNRLKKYFSQFESQVSHNLNPQYIKLDLLFKIIFFKYDLLTRNFLISDIGDEVTPINVADFYSVVDVLEKIYRLFTSFNVSYQELFIMDDFFDYFRRFPIEKGNDEIVEIARYQDAILKIFHNIEELQKEIPFTVIFQYLYKNLFYQSKQIVYSSHINDIYRTYKRTILEKLWENRYHELKYQNIMEMIHELMPGFNFNTLEYFNFELKKNLEKYSQKIIEDFYALNLICEFLKKLYLNNLEVYINKILIDGIFKKEQVHSNLSAAYYSLNSMVAKITAFDNKFKTDNVMEKKVTMTLRKVANDPNYKSPLINIVSDINSESQELRKEAEEAIRFITQFCHTLMDLNNPSNIPITNFALLRFTGYSSSYSATEYAINLFQNFYEIYQLVVESFI
ncbi:MAG: DUF5312 domain-containing protein [Spirochaetes bacterium]|nr:DUF5312 domain-containing protein [Spirochaetota bacterium]